MLLEIVYDMRACLRVSVKSPLSTHTASNKSVAQVSVLRGLSQTAHKKGTHIKIRFLSTEIPILVDRKYQKQFLSSEIPILVDRTFKKQFLSTEIPILVDRTFKNNFYPRKCPFWWTKCGQKDYVNIKGVM